MLILAAVNFPINGKCFFYVVVLAQKFETTQDRFFTENMVEFILINIKYVCLYVALNLVLIKMNGLFIFYAAYLSMFIIKQRV